MRLAPGAGWAGTRAPCWRRSGTVRHSLSRSRGEEAAPWGPAIETAFQLRCWENPQTQIPRPAQPVPCADAGRAEVLWSQCHLLLKLHPTCPRGPRGLQAASLHPGPPPFPLCLSAGKSAGFCQRFGRASLLSKEKFEIPFLEKNVPSRQWVSGCRDSTPEGIWFGFLMENPVRGQGRKSPHSLIITCGFPTSFIVALPSWVFT